MTEEQLNAFLEKVNPIPNYRKSSRQQPYLMLLLKSPKTQALQLPQKIFNQCNRQRQNCQMKSWKKQLVVMVDAIALRCLMAGGLVLPRTDQIIEGADLIQGDNRQRKRSKANTK